MTIYGIRFEGRVIYVGQTSKEARQRFWQHKALAKAGKRFCPKLYNHMRKNELIGYDLVTLEVCDDSLAEEREKYWISFYGTFLGGCNLHPGGNQTRGEHHYMYGQRPDAAIKASVAARTGTKLSERHKEKIRRANTGRKQPSNYIAITCDQNGKTYEKLQDAALDLGICDANIGQFLSGKVASVHGFTFKYADPQKELKRPIKRLKNNQAIFCKETGIVYHSMKEASKILGIDYIRIYKTVTGFQKSVKGFTFERVDRDVDKYSIRRNYL